MSREWCLRQRTDRKASSPQQVNIEERYIEGFDIVTITFISSSHRWTNLLTVVTSAYTSSMVTHES